ncbi:predicted protein [Naegleria gruberi]|uniref:Predicted protein n=1 Tax=Naegleria gruberi TaxID=5762 RepID=D2VFL8_NAEGR|nr:uncharacterized protein NAEGRDRAFT_67670 [Naegleria gruberi]EFC44382.1 predicted protein [Naegleria gruberi]|eukprot:XP_002677126.1 predicted protein [Naegleria gruberi strain NEG-M]
MFRNEFNICDEWFDEKVDLFFDRIKKYGLLDYSIRTRSDRIYCNEILQNSTEFIFQIIKNEEKAKKYAPKRANECYEEDEIVETNTNSEIDLEDKNSILNDLKKRSDSYIFKNISPSLKGDAEFILQALKYCPDAYILDFVDSTLKQDREFIKQAVKVNPYSIAFASQFLRNDFEIAKETLLLNADCFRYLSYELRSNEELAMMALKELPFLWTYLSEDLFNCGICIESH